MKRAELIKWKELALDRMFLCASMFHGNNPPQPQHCVEMQAHAALVQAIIAELGPPLTLNTKPAFDRARLQACVERLNEFVSNEASPTRLVEETLRDLRHLVGPGGEA